MSEIRALVRRILDARPRVLDLTADELDRLTAYLAMLPALPPPISNVRGSFSGEAIGRLQSSIPDPAGTERLRREHLEYVRLAAERRLSVLMSANNRLSNSSSAHAAISAQEDAGRVRDPEARWARLLSGESGSDPETRVLILHEKWENAGDDRQRRYDVFVESLAWLVAELNECARLGRLATDAPTVEASGPLHDGVDLSNPDAALLDLYWYRVEECLRRAVRKASDFGEQVGLGMEVAAGLKVAAESYGRSSFMADAIRSFERASRVLTPFVRHVGTAPMIQTKANSSASGTKPLLTLGKAPSASKADGLTPGAKAIGAALDIQKEGKPVTLKGACDRAQVDRGHVRERYPDAVKAIKAIGSADRGPRRGTRDRRTGDVDGVDNPED